MTRTALFFLAIFLGLALLAALPPLPAHAWTISENFDNNGGAETGWVTDNNCNQTFLSPHNPITLSKWGSATSPFTYGSGTPQIRGASSPDCATGTTITGGGAHWSWVVSGTSTVYRLLYDGANPNIASCGAVTAGGTLLTWQGGRASMTAGSWWYGDGDTLGYKTVYAKLASGADPDAEPTTALIYYPGGGSWCRSSEWAHSGTYSFKRINDTLGLGSYVPNLKVSGFGGKTGYWVTCWFKAALVASAGAQKLIDVAPSGPGVSNSWLSFQLCGSASPDPAKYVNWEFTDGLCYPVKLAYDGQTANFAVGETVTGGTSHTTAIIVKDTDSGANGLLELSTIIPAGGNFTTDETLTGSLGGAAVVYAPLDTNGYRGHANVLVVEAWGLTDPGATGATPYATNTAVVPATAAGGAASDGTSTTLHCEAGENLSALTTPTDWVAYNLTTGAFAPVTAADDATDTVTTKALYGVNRTTWLTGDYYEIVPKNSGRFLHTPRAYGTRLDVHVIPRANDADDTIEMFFDGCWRWTRSNDGALYSNPTGGLLYHSINNFDWGTGMGNITFGNVSWDAAGACTPQLFDDISVSDTEPAGLTRDPWATSTNHAPVLAAIGNQNGTEVTPFSINGSATDPEDAASTLRFTCTGKPAWATFTDNLDGTWVLAGASPTAGATDNILITVTDPGALTDSETFSIYITPVNHPPILVAIGNQLGTAGTLLTFTAVATPEDAGQTITYSGSNLPGDSSINPTTGIFTWTSPTTGRYADVIFTSTDDGSPTQSDSETIVIRIVDTNAAPVLAAIGNKTIEAGQTLTFTLSATDSDIGQTLSFVPGDPLPGDATLDDTTGIFRWIPGYLQSGNYSVPLYVFDSGTPQMSDSETITITVTARSRARDRRRPLHLFPGVHGELSQARWHA